MIGFGRAIFGRDDVVDRLDEIAVPTLVMVGEFDDPQPIERAQVIADGIDGAQLHVIPGAGHLSSIENPDDVNGVLEAFLANGELPLLGAAGAGARTPRSIFYDGAVYGRMVEPLLRGVHGFVADNLPESERVLDACCGTGGLAHRIAATGRHVTGVDLSPRNIEFARHHGSGTSVVFDVCDVSDLPYDDGAFDLATIVLALHEMPTYSRVPVLRELGRVAKRVLVVDYEVPMPRNVAGIRNRAMEAVAGREHFTAFRDYSKRGGLTALLHVAELHSESKRTLDGGTLIVQVAQR
jgi:SAM-dependent methyltransferase